MEKWLFDDIREGNEIRSLNLHLNLLFKKTTACFWTFETQELEKRVADIRKFKITSSKVDILFTDNYKYSITMAVKARNYKTVFVICKQNSDTREHRWIPTVDSHNIIQLLTGWEVYI